MQHHPLVHEDGSWSIGARRIAMSAALAIVPLAIWGLWKVLFSGQADVVFIVGVMTALLLAWFVLLVRLVLSFVEKRASRIRVKRIAMSVALAIIALIIWGLYKLATLPYRPPHDMSTFLGQEVILVWGMIGVLSVVWIFLLVRVGLSFIGKANEHVA